MIKPIIESSIFIKILRKSILSLLIITSSLYKIRYLRCFRIHNDSTNKWHMIVWENFQRILVSINILQLRWVILSRLFKGLLTLYTIEGKTFSTFEASRKPKINNFIIAPKACCWVHHVDYGSWKLNIEKVAEYFSYLFIRQRANCSPYEFICTFGISW